jgi:outer membrane protein OmpA-like peptidoglycan-associated protein
LRYGVSRWLSIGLIAGYEELKTENSVAIPEWPHLYEKLHAYPAALALYFHLGQSRSVFPYFYIGGGTMFYTRRTGTGDPVPDEKFKTTFLIPGGIGLDAALSRDVLFSLSAGIAAIGDDVELKKNESPDGFLNARIGLSFFLGSSDDDDDDEDGLTNGQERRYATDALNPDTDGDGLKDGEEVRRYRTNPLRTDTDGDGLPDGDEVMKYQTDPARTDTDNDNLPDGEEISKYKSDPLKGDTDGDGLPDGEEVLRTGTDPLRVDTDGDGLSDWDESRVYNTNPTSPDSDSDGLSDGAEVKKHKTDPMKIDTDGGGMNDGAEVQRSSNPLDRTDDMRGEGLTLERGKSVLLEGVNFETGSSRLTRSSEQTLERAFIAMVANPDLNVEVVGHTDNTGSVAVNDRLSRQRADAVKAWLIRKGIDPRRITTTGRGGRDPIAPNTTSLGRAENRRIEFRVR